MITMATRQKGICLRMRRRVQRFVTVLLAALALLAGAVSPARADIYYFEDPDGVMHFTNVPVDGRFRFKEKENAKKVKVFVYESNERQFDPMIHKVAKQEGIDPALLRSLISVESGFDPVAISPKGAMGLMQLMPETAKRLGVNNAFHPEENLEAGARHLRTLMEKYEGDLQLALAAYNAGEKAVEAYDGIPPFLETETYVREVLRRYQAEQHKPGSP
jgi:soluble lytic murein transglycosylase-like protein